MKLTKSRQQLAKYIIDHCIRGACTCGKCIDAPAKKFQPDGHTADVQFFKVALKNTRLTDVDKEVMKNNLIQLGELLGMWKVATLNRLAPDFSAETRSMLAGQKYNGK